MGAIKFIVTTYSKGDIPDNKGGNSRTANNNDVYRAVCVRYGHAKSTSTTEVNK